MIKNIGTGRCSCKGTKCDCAYRGIGRYGYGDVGGSSAAESVFLPTLWIEARNLGVAYADGNRISLAVDLSTHKQDLQQATAGNQPLYKYNSGFPYIDFDDANRRISRSFAGSQHITDFIGLNAGTVMFTINHYDNTQPTTPYNWNAADSSNRFMSHCSYSDNNIYVDWGNILGGGRVSFAEPAGWHTGFHLVEYNRNGNGFTGIIDGVELYNNAAAFSDAIDDTTTQVFGLGNVAGFGFRMSAIMFWDKSLTASQQSSVRDYLNSFRP